MIRLLPFLLLFSSCHTTITTRDFSFRTYSNAARIAVTGPDVSFEATGLNHSTPSAAAFFGISNVLTAGGTAALPWATGAPAIVRAAPVVPATLPVFRVR